MMLDDQVRDVYAEHGATLGDAQLLERYLGYTILAAQDQSDSESFADMSMGRLIRRLRRLVPLSSSISARLEAARDKRNWLAHRYFSDRATLFQTASGRAEMVRELGR